MTSDPYRYFRIEARELVDQLDRGVREVGRGAAGRAEVAELLRLAHTLKGAARVVKRLETADVAHAIEEVLAPFRSTTDPVPTDVGARLAALVDQASDHVALLPGPPGAATEGAGGVAAGSAALPGGASPEPASPIAGRDGAGTPAGTSAAPPPPQVAATTEIFTAVAADAVEIDSLLESVGEARAELARLQRGTDTLHRARSRVELIAQQLNAPGNRAATRLPDATRELVRSTVGELDSELVLFARTLAEAVERVDRELAEVRASGERLSLVPADTLFPALRRVAADAARVEGKRVNFDADGGGIRLDPQVVSAVYGALQHVVRNAVVHGIEAAPDRLSAGKPAEGRVTVTVARRGTLVTFACRDDGAGFDLNGLRRAAKTANGLTEAEVAALSTQQLIDLVLGGGISTSGSVNEVAGRGVGLDAARAVSARLRGKVAVHTDAGRGTTVELTVPLSMLSVEAMTIDVAGGLVAVPLEAVLRCLPLHAADVARSAEGATVLHDGVALPLVPLASLLSRTPDAATLAAGRPPPRVGLVVAAPSGTVAVGVDRVLGTAPVVVRAVPDLASTSPVVGGLWMNGDGDPRIMLDPVGLVDAARRANPEPAVADRPNRRVLVIDDSVTTRMLERSILESAGYDVDVAASAEEGLTKASGGGYGLFLVDIEMPGMDGFTFVEHTKADPVLRDIPSILVSSRASEEDRRRGVEAGARLHVAKHDFDQNDLLRRIGELVS
jgi:two-component system chemotaxis sensor kinase CheA